MNITPITGVALALGLVALPAVAAPFDKLYAFGDSLNDCCRNPLAPFTNGPETWLPDLAAQLGATYAEDVAHNYAVGGAQVGPVNAIAQADIDLGYLTGFTSQAERFRDDAPAVGSHDLGVVWVSTNDAWPSAHEGPMLFGAVPFNRPVGVQPSVEDFTTYIVDTLRTGIDDLLAGGIEKLMILTPYDMANSGLWDTPAARDLNTAYTLALRDALERLSTPGAETWVLDMVTLLEEAKPGFAFDTAAQSCQAIGDGLNCDDHIFLDSVHLTTAMNAIVADEAAALLLTTDPVAAIPLPAGFVLLAGAGGALALLRRRR